MAADEYARLLGDEGIISTEDTSYHRTLPQRLETYGIAKGKVSEVMDFGCSTAEEVIEWLLIDDGLASRKRRNTLLDPDFRFVGIGTNFHRVHGFVTVIILAEDFNSLGISLSI